MPYRSRKEHCPAHGREARDEIVYDRAEGAALADALRDRLFRMSMITNTAGAVIVCVFLAFLLPISVPSIDRNEELRLLLIGMGFGAVYLAVTFWIGHRWARRICAPGYEFLEEGRAPTESEREVALRMPLRLMIVPMTFWSLGALLLAGLYATESTDLGMMVFDAIFLGGLTTSALEYLFTERIWRQVVVLALLDDAPTRAVSPGIRARLTTAWALASGVPLLGIVAIASSSTLGAPATDPDLLPASVTFLALVAVGTGLLATKLVARSVAEPVGGLREALARIESGDLSAGVTVDDGSEIGQLQAGFNRMARGLREQERLRELFGRQVGRDVAEAALRGEIALGGETREVGVLFVDLIGSTTMSEELPPDEVVTLLNSFFTTVVDTVAEDGGWVNKFEGDGALCVFGAPVDVDNPAAAALCAARTLRRRLRQELPGVDAGIGVSAGQGVAGNIGAQERFEYTVIGDPVNEAARLCELAKRRPDRTLASGRALDLATEREVRHWATDGEVVLRGRRTPTTLATLAAREPSQPAFVPELNAAGAAAEDRALAS